MDKKRCCKCKVEKEKLCFQKNKSTKDGLQHWCKDCCKKHQRNPNNKEYKKEYRLRHENKIAKYGHEYQLEYRQRNRDEKNRKEREYRKKRKEEDVNFRMALNLRNRIWRLVRKCNGDKKHLFIELIGCTKGYLREHLECLFTEGMTWRNYGNGDGKWNIDHIRPCSSFDLTDTEQQRECFYYTNLRPMWSLENFSKGAKYFKNN